MTFDDCLTAILKEEGGYVNNPKDPGGETNLGVTRKTWEAYTSHPTTTAVMKALTVAQVAPLYRNQYWRATGCPDMPAPLALCVFDFAVNAGPARAVKFLQSLVGTWQDGRFGLATRGALQMLVAAKGLAEVIRNYMNARRAYYRSLGTFTTFGKGWMARCDRIETAALKGLA